MPEIKLIIDCGERFCGNCRFRGFNSELYRYMPYCEAFGKGLEEHKISKRKKTYVRCQECLAADTGVPTTKYRKEQFHAKLEGGKFTGWENRVTECTFNECGDCTAKENCDVYKHTEG